MITLEGFQTGKVSSITSESTRLGGSNQGNRATNPFDFPSKEDKREYKMPQDNNVAYSNPLSLESLFGTQNSSNSETSAMDA